MAIRKYFSFFIVALVAMQVLNLGLYAQDFDTIGKDASGYTPNIINSVTEYFAEVVMEKRDAFPEKKEKSNQNDHETVFKFQPFKIYASNSQQSLLLCLAEDRNYIGYLVHSYRNHTTDITSPPPKA